ncbi:hypothetical protein HGA88_05365 [Candidatus Roizmanbacteria bacterium]|nr:hypothetical protein [Candidatus Roizmanbacteria bacterium]
MFQQNKKNHFRWIWNIEKVETALSDQEYDTLIICGASDNQDQFLTLIHRVVSRGNEHGSHPIDLTRQPEWNKTTSPNLWSANP